MANLKVPIKYISFTSPGELRRHIVGIRPTETQFHELTEKAKRDICSLFGISIDCAQSDLQTELNNGLKRMLTGDSEAKLIIDIETSNGPILAISK